MATKTDPKTAPGGSSAPRRPAAGDALPAEALPLLRRAHGGAVPAGPPPRRHLLRARAGGNARRRRVRAGEGRLAVPDAPRSVRAADEGSRPQARDGAVLGTDRRLHAWAGRQQPHRRLGGQPDVHGHLAPPDRVPGRVRRRARVQAQGRAPRRHGDLRRRIHVERPLARGPELVGGPPAPRGVGRQQQPVRLLHAEPARVPRPHDRRARGGVRHAGRPRGRRRRRRGLRDGARSRRARSGRRRVRR